MVRGDIAAKCRRLNTADRSAVAGFWQIPSQEQSRLLR